jgi:6-phospho-beta-glucosidase
MKLTMIGGGGIRTPLAILPVIRRAERLGLKELCLMDINETKLQIFGMLACDVAKRMESNLKITLTTDAIEALSDSDFVITTIRVGDDYGRVLDERIALHFGVLGQETTGAGGFAMATRSIPVILEYAKLLRDLNPDAWILNFTNPAGLVTQALRDQGFERTIGICDSANSALNAVSRYLEIDSDDLESEVFGLNHLSWGRSVKRAGKELLTPLLREEDFHGRTLLRLFDSNLVREIGMWLNEYLYYWYYSREALETIQNEELTRGESILRWNSDLIGRLQEIDIETDINEARTVYEDYMKKRIGTYMSHTDEGQEEFSNPLSMDEEEGYMGVALDTILSLHTDTPLRTALNVPNEGAIDCMNPSDVVEVSCIVDGAGVHPQKIGEIPKHQEILMNTVKLYEKLTVEATLKRSKFIAVQALMNHPLIYSYPLAIQLVNEYIQAHGEFVGDWN